jgi:hypothetical protein
MKWMLKYLKNQQYKTLVNAAKVMGMEPVPSELLLDHGSRYGVSNRMVKIGKASFYLLKESEMPKGLAKRYQEFKGKMAEFCSNSITI